MTNKRGLLLLALLIVLAFHFVPPAKALAVFATASGTDPCYPNDNVLWDAYEAFVYTCTVTGLPVPINPLPIVTASASVWGTCTTIVLTTGNWGYDESTITAQMYGRAGGGQSVAATSTCYPDGYCVSTSQQYVPC